MNTMVEPSLQRKEDEPAALSQLVTAAKYVLEQAIDFVETLKSDDLLTTNSTYLPGSTIGKHLRHARDHYTLLFDCLSSPAPRILNYDVRIRDTPVESQRQAASDALKDTVARAEKLLVSGANLDDPLTLNAVTPHFQVLETTFGRELWFSVLHNIHHLAMIRVIAGELKLEIADESFGFAPSTLTARNGGAPLSKAKY